MYKIKIPEVRLITEFSDTINLQSSVNQAETDTEKDNKIRKTVLPVFQSLSELDRESFLFAVYKVHHSIVSSVDYSPEDLAKVESVKLKVWLTKFVSFALSVFGLLFIAIFSFVAFSTKVTPDMSIILSFFKSFEEVLLAIINAGNQK